MDINKVVQENISTEGHFIGHDYIDNSSTDSSLTVNNPVVNNYTFNSNGQPSVSMYLVNLYKKLRDEAEKEPCRIEFIEELDYYNSQVENEELMGLENKLEAGNRRNILWFAKEVKERFHQKLLRTSQFSEVCQQINIHLLSTVYAYFISDVYPKICNGESFEEIEKAIKTNIVDPIFTELGENHLRYTRADIQGMIYFLTGNCHIKWTKDQC